MIESWFLNCISITNHKQNIAYSSRSLCVFSDIFHPLWTLQKQYKIFNIMKQSCLQLLLKVFLARCMKSHKVALVSGHLDFGLIYTHIFCVFTVTESLIKRAPSLTFLIYLLLFFYFTYLLACVLYLATLSSAFILTTRWKTTTEDFKRRSSDDMFFIC